MRILLVAIAVLSFSGCGMKTGDEALALMSPSQKKIVEFMLSLTSNSTIEDINSSLGSATDMGVAGANPSWELRHGESTTQLRAYFLTGGLNKVQYISLSPMWGYTVYYDETGAWPGT